MSDEEISRLLQQALPKIQVVGVGGAGLNTLARLPKVGLTGVQTLAVDTDAQQVRRVRADQTWVLEPSDRKRLCAFKKRNPATHAAIEEMKRRFIGDLVLIVCGLGGRTGTEVAPVLAHLAHTQGAKLTVGVCTFPARQEGLTRWNTALAGVASMAARCNTLIMVSHECFARETRTQPRVQVVQRADMLVGQTIQTLSELILCPQRVCFDFSQVLEVFWDAGLTLVGSGRSSLEGHQGLNNAGETLWNTLSLQGLELDSVTRALFEIRTQGALKLQEMVDYLKEIKTQLAKDARIVWSASIDPTLGQDAICVTGFCGRLQRSNDRSGWVPGME